MSSKRSLADGWSTSTLGTLCDFVRGVNFDKGDVSNKPIRDHIPILRAGNIGEKLDTQNGLIYVPRRYVASDQMLRQGDIAICLSSGSAALVGKTAILERGFEGSVGAFCGIIRSKNLGLNKYLAYWLRSSSFWSWRDSQSSGVNIQNLQFSAMATIEVRHPASPYDQDAFVKDLDGKMAEVEKMRQVALRQREAVASMQGAILREVFPWKEGERLPEGWRWAKIESEVDNSVASFMKSNHSEEYFNYIDISSVDEITKQITGSTEIRVEEAPSRAKYVLRQNDIIVSTVRPNLNAVAMITEAQDGHIGSSGFCVVRPKRGHYPSYFFYHLISPRFVESVSEMVQGAMYPAIRDEDVKAFKIPLPANTEEEASITARFDHRMGEIERIRQSAGRQLEAIEALPGAILREALDFEEEG